MTTPATATGDPPPPLYQPPPPIEVTLQPPDIVVPPIVPPIIDDLDDDDRTAGIAALDGATVAMPHSALKTIKSKAAERARKLAQSELDEKLKAAGFDNIEAAIAQAQKAKETPVTVPPEQITPPPAGTPAPIATPIVAAAPVIPAAAAPPPATPEEAAEDRRLSPQLRKKLKEVRTNANAQVTAAQAQVTAAQAQVAASTARVAQMEAERDMRDVMVGAGCKEMDFTFDALRKHLKGLDDAAIKTFKIEEWVAETKKTKPFLFGLQVAPATTGAPAGAPTPPSPGAAAGAATPGVVDTRKMSRDQLAAHLKSRGLNAPLGYSKPMQ